MELNNRLASLEEDFNILKNEIKQVLLDIREQILHWESPFADYTPPAATGAKEREEPARPVAPPKMEEPEPPAPGPEEERPAPDGLDGDLPDFRGLPVLTRHQTGQMDIATLSALANWAWWAVRRVGRRRAEALVRVYQLSGYLSEETGQALGQLLDLADGEEPPAKVTMRDCTLALLRLDAALGARGGANMGLLALLWEGDRQEL